MKICGLTNLPDAELAVELGAWALGMIFYEGSPRRCAPAEAARRTGTRVIKAVQVAGPGDVRDVERFHVDFHLLDARAKARERQGLRGGTGETFDWALVSRRRSKVPLILSGGLTAQNVAEAIAQTHPYAVDTASATESAPGHKDPEKLRAFFAAVQQSVQPTLADEGSAAEDTAAAVGGSQA